MGASKQLVFRSPSLVIQIEIKIDPCRAKASKELAARGNSLFGSSSNDAYSGRKPRHAVGAVHDIRNLVQHGKDAQTRHECYGLQNKHPEQRMRKPFPARSESTSKKAQAKDCGEGWHPKSWTTSASWERSCMSRVKGCRAKMCFTLTWDKAVAGGIGLEEISDSDGGEKRHWSIETY